MYLVFEVPLACGAMAVAALLAPSQAGTFGIARVL